MNNSRLTLLALALTIGLPVSALAQSDREAMTELQRLFGGAMQLPPAKVAEPKVVSNDILLGSAWQQRAARIGKKSVGMVRTMSGSGTGFIISPDGLMVTNAHVVQGGAMMGQVQVVFEGAASPVFARVLAVGDPNKMDIAFLQLPVLNDDNGNHVPYVALTLRKNAAIAIGTPVVAIGYPLGIGYSVASGLVSGEPRKIPGNSYATYFQTDAAVNPGNSGGPLIAQDGSVIGMNSMGTNAAGAPVSSGLNFALLSDDILRGWELYKKSGGLRPMWLGLRFSPNMDDSSPALLDVKQIFPGPAQKAGIQLEDGVSKINGKVPEDLDAFLREIHYSAPGEVVKLTIIRAGKEMEIAVTLEPEEPTPRSIVGLDLSSSK